MKDLTDSLASLLEAEQEVPKRREVARAALRLQRRIHNVSLKALGSAVGIPTSNLSEMETGKRRITAKQLSELHYHLCLIVQNRTTSARVIVEDEA